MPATEISISEGNARHFLRGPDASIEEERGEPLPSFRPSVQSLSTDAVSTGGVQIDDEPSREA
jgi:hypothetical protein